MKLKTVLSIYAVTAAGFCVGLLVLPAFWIRLYGAHDDVQATVLLRLTGAWMGGIAVMAWRGRNSEFSPARDAMVLGLSISNGLAALVALWGALSHVYNQFAWGPVVTFATFAVAFLLARRRSAPANVRAA